MMPQRPSIFCMADATCGFPLPVRCPRDANTPAIFRYDKPSACNCLANATVSGIASAYPLRPSHLPCASRLRSRAALSFATSLAFSSCANVPAICKARHLDVGEVIVFGIISGPSELVIKVRSLRRPVGGCSSLSCRCPHASFVREALSSLCAESSIARIALRRPPMPSGTSGSRRTNRARRFRRRSLGTSIATRAGARRRHRPETRRESKLAVRLPETSRFTRQRIELRPTC
jgi:hypothetical protein